MALSEINRFSGDEDRRKSRRYLLPDDTPVVAMSGGKIYTCRIADISMGGVGLRFDGEAPHGNVIALEHPSAGTMCGMCVWKRAETVGVELHFPKRELERVLRCISLVL